MARQVGEVGLGLQPDTQGAAIFVCGSPACGLRFPVLPSDRFIGQCPRCGEPVTQVATVQPQPVPRQPRHAGPELHLLLDNWRSLFNTGAIFRTADGAGITSLHLCGITPTPDHRKLAKTALGAEREVAWSYAPDGVARGAALRAQGMALWVLEGGDASRALWAQRLPIGQPVVLAAGNEVAGVDPGLVALADRVIHVPMAGSKESLNVAIALSVAVYWLIGQV